VLFSPPPAKNGAREQGCPRGVCSQQTPAEAPPNRPVALDAPAVAGTAEQGGLDDTVEVGAIACGACVELLETSPGNCLGVCGSADGDALMPTVDPVEASPFAEFGCGTGNVVGMVEAGTLSRSDPQPVFPVGALGVEHGV
jgi:hypothetical protein